LEKDDIDAPKAKDLIVDSKKEDKNKNNSLH